MPKKEVIIADAYSDEDFHGQCHETTISDDEHNFESIIGTQNVYCGKVRITIEEIE